MKKHLMTNESNVGIKSLLTERQCWLQAMLRDDKVNVKDKGNVKRKKWHILTVISKTKTDTKWIKILSNQLTCQSHQLENRHCSNPLILTTYQQLFSTQ